MLISEMPKFLIPSRQKSVGGPGVNNKMETKLRTLVEVTVSYDVTVYGILSVLLTVVQKLETTV